MKRFFLAQAALCLLIASCTVNEVESIDIPTIPEKAVFYATLESGAEPDTKVYVDENIKILWDGDDRVSIFNRSTWNQEFRFTGDPGTNSGAFEEVTPSGTADPIGLICSVYPYRKTTSISSEGVLTLDLPAKQAYRAGSFGPGANTMVSATNDNELKFKNVGGYLLLQFYGEGVSVSSVKLEGNRGEPLAGLATMTPAIGVDPQITLAPSTGKAITLACETPVQLNSSPDDATIFWLVVPPTRFSGGIRVTVTDASGEVFVIDTSMDLTVSRNKVLRISPVEVPLSQPELCDIEQTKVRKYLEEVDYTADTDYTYSALYGSDNGYVGSTKYDYPKPATITWSGNNADKVQISTSPSFIGTVREMSTSSSSTSADVYNLIPGTVYFYRVVKADGSSIKEGSLIPQGPLRMVYLTEDFASDNFRDLGGWKAGNRTIRYGVLYRGAKIDGISDAAKDVFINTLGIGLDIDLRGYAGSSGAGEEKQVITEIDYGNYPVYKLLGKGTGETSGIYRSAIRRIITFLKDDGRAVYFHCVGGGDRAGTLAFLIEALVGVSESDISKDYELTTFTVKNKRYRHVTANGSQFTSEQKKYPFKDLILYLRNNYPADTMQEMVTKWATTGENALTEAEIADLQALILE